MLRELRHYDYHFTLDQRVNVDRLARRVREALRTGRLSEGAEGMGDRLDAILYDDLVWPKPE